MLNPDMTSQEIRLHMGELIESVRALAGGGKEGE